MFHVQWGVNNVGEWMYSLGNFQFAVSDMWQINLLKVLVLCLFNI